jgi:hypothetical protein
MAAVTEGNQVGGIVVGSFPVSVMDMKPFTCTAQNALSVVPFEYLFSEILPAFKSIFLPCSDDNSVVCAFEALITPRRVIAAVTPASETVQMRSVTAERYAVRIERFECQLDVRRHCSGFL